MLNACCPSSKRPKPDEHVRLAYISRHDKKWSQNFYLHIVGNKRYTRIRCDTCTSLLWKKVNDVRVGHKLEHKTACHRLHRSRVRIITRPEKVSFYLQTFRYTHHRKWYLYLNWANTNKPLKYLVSGSDEQGIFCMFFFLILKTILLKQYLKSLQHFRRASSVVIHSAPRRLSCNRL